MNPVSLGFLGLGKMGQALALSVRDNPGYRLFGYDPVLAGEQAMNGIQATKDAVELEASVDLMLLCIKPDQLTKATQGLKGNKTYLSILAGVSLDRLQACLGPQARVARAMPNICALSGNAVSALYCPDAELRSRAQALLEQAGSCILVDQEEDMHAVTGLSGSGPAFVALVIQALAEGGVLSGLSYQTALALARATVRGTAAHLEKTLDHPEVLRNQVTSAGGTTIAGLLELEKGSVRGHIAKAVSQAAQRSRELGK